MRLVLLEALREAPPQGAVQREPGLFTLSMVVNSESLRPLSVERLEWFERKRMENPERALGRLAVYLDLQQGIAKSRLWKALSSHIEDLKDLSVCIVADTFSDEASGLVGDVAYLVQAIAKPGQLRRVDLFLACQHMNWGDEISDIHRHQRTFATFRELQRLQTKRPKRFDYAPGLAQPVLDQEHSEALVDEIYLFDGLAERYEETGQAHDYSERRPEESIFPVMAGCLLALLCAPVRSVFYQHAVNRTSIPARVSQERGKGLEYRAGAMGSHAVCLPADELCRIAELRLVHEALFHQEHGLFRWETLPTSQDEKPQTAPWAPEIAPADVQAFEARLGPCGRNLHAQAFGERLRDYLALRMNVSKAGALQWAKAFLEVVEQRWPAHQEVARSARRSVEAWLDLVGKVPAGKPTPQGPFQSKGDPFAEFFAPRQAETERRATEHASGTLLKNWQERWREAKQHFEEMAIHPTQHLLLRPEDEPEVYKKYVEPQKWWQAMQERVWWLWGQKGEDFELRLLVLPPNLEAPDPSVPGRSLRESIGRSPAYFSLGTSQPVEILQRFLEITHCYMQAPLETLKGYPEMDRPKMEEVARETWERACLLVRTHKFAEAREVYGYLMVPQGQGKVWEGLQKALQQGRPVRQGVSPDWRFQVVEAPDPFTLRFLQVEHMLLMDTLEPYVKAKERYIPQPRLHVWKEEAQVTSLEKEAREFVGGTKAVFSPDLVWFLAHHPEETLLFGRCTLYSLLEMEQARSSVSAADDLLLDALGFDRKDLLGSDLYQALEKFVRALSDPAKGDIRAKVAGLLEERRPSDLLSLQKAMNRTLEGQIWPLLLSGGTASQDLGLLMAFAARKEQDRMIGQPWQRG